VIEIQPAECTAAITIMSPLAQSRKITPSEDVVIG
jgi:hypothetical protein